MTDAPGGDLRRAALAVGVVAVASAVLGGLTSPLQGVLPAAVSSVANSASGWTILTTLLVLAVRPARVAVAAVAGGTSFVLLVLGYQTVSTWRGHPTSEVLFLAVGVVAGPLVGVAASWLRAAGRRAALGAGLLAGVLVGEGLFGLALLLQSTSPVYWIAVVVLGAALVAVVALRSATSGRDRLLLVGATTGVALLFDVAFAAASGIL